MHYKAVGTILKVLMVNWQITESESRSVISDALWPHGLYSPWNSPDQNTGVGSPSLLQQNFPTQGSNPGLPHCRQILYQLIHQGSPRILEWVAYPFSSRSFQPRNRTRVSCIAGGFLTNWATREALDMNISIRLSISADLSLFYHLVIQTNKQKINNHN